jgi:hypothetical protein
MKTTSYLFALLIVILVISTAALAQVRMPVKVKNSEVVTGVVIVHVLKNARSLDLQCNEGAGDCKVLPSGDYLMVELPENYGMYDCQNVEIYRGDQRQPESAQKIGEYCLVESK